MEENMTNRDRGNAIFDLGIRYGQIPSSLLKDDSVLPQGKVLYCVYHCHSKDKNLGGNPFSFASQEHIAKEWLKCSREYVSKLTNHLQERGWATIIHLGQGHPNIIVIHGFKGQKLSSFRELEFRRELMAYYKKIEEG